MPDQTNTLPGLHHITAIASDAQQNINFYAGILGLRLVKLTVNFDDPSSYHLYYGDQLGRPGTIMTFFAWPGARRGRIGVPQAASTAFAIPGPSVDYWKHWLALKSVSVTDGQERFGDRVLKFVDPDGLQIELVESDISGQPWGGGTVPAEHAIRGFHSVTVVEEGYESTARLLAGTMGFTPDGVEQDRYRFRAAGGTASDIIDILCTPGGPRGSMGAGVVHHVAFRTPDDASQLAWHQTIAAGGLNVSPVMDRTYFHSIYFREPGGVLFEIATDQPGFTADEPANKLGTRLMLPPWLETQRAAIERAVPAVVLPGGPTAA